MDTLPCVSFFRSVRWFGLYMTTSTIRTLLSSYKMDSARIRQATRLLRTADEAEQFYHTAHGQGHAVRILAVGGYESLISTLHFARQERAHSGSNFKLS